MKYNTGSAFRRALETRLRNQSLQTGLPLLRLRKMVAFDRFLARLTSYHVNNWVLKGGLALQLRLGEHSRTTKDMDLLALGHHEDIHHALRNAGNLDLDDWFSFEVAQPDNQRQKDFGGMRFLLNGLLDSRTFEEFHIDVGLGDIIVEPVEFLKTPALLEFAGIPPTEVQCFPITQQIAEKIHAFTRFHTSGEVSRTKDLVDILLLAELGEIDGKHLWEALQSTFDHRQTHPLPGEFPDAPENWITPYRRIAADVKLNYPSLEDANEAARRFIDPILSGEIEGRWDPGQWTWI